MLNPWFSLVVSSPCLIRKICCFRGWFSRAEIGCLNGIEFEVLAERLWQVQVHWLEARGEQMQRVPGRQWTSLVTTSQKCGQWKQSMHNMRNRRLYMMDWIITEYHQVKLKSLWHKYSSEVTQMYSKSFAGCGKALNQMFLRCFNHQEKLVCDWWSRFFSGETQGLSLSPSIHNSRHKNESFPDAPCTIIHRIFTYNLHWETFGYS